METEKEAGVEARDRDQTENRDKKENKEKENNWGKPFPRTETIGSVILDYSGYPGEDFYCDGAVEDELLQDRKSVV